MTYWFTSRFQEAPRECHLSLTRYQHICSKHDLGYRVFHSRVFTEPNVFLKAKGAWINQKRKKFKHGKLFLREREKIFYKYSGPYSKLALKVGDFQKKIGIIYRLKQICCFAILNFSFEFSRFFATDVSRVSLKISCKTKTNKM